MMANESPTTMDGSLSRDGNERDDECRHALSRLMDGDADAGQAQRLCGAWKDAREVRATWHAFHLIGDMLRSEELVSDAKRDAEFLNRLRQRLADEPAIVAPQPVVAEPDDSFWGGRMAVRWRKWAPPVAVAASFMAVAGAMVAARLATPSIDGMQPSALAAAGGAPAAVSVHSAGAALADAFAEPQAQPFNDKLLQDAHLGEYFTAHKQFGGSTALGLPSDFLRNATYEVPGH